MFIRRMLLGGLLDPDTVDLAGQLGEQFDLKTQILPSSSPKEESSLATILAGAEIAFICLDDGTSLPWLDYLNRRDLEIPIIGLFSNYDDDQCDMEPLLQASSLGLDGVISLPLCAEAMEAQLLRYFQPRRPQEPEEPIAQAQETPEPAKIASSFIANASPKNQALLKTLVDNSNETAFLVAGPAGCEIELLLKEISLHTKRATELIDLTEAAPQAILQPEKISSDSKCRVYFLPFPRPPRPVPETLAGLVRLDLEPLQFRPTDLAQYAANWLPKLYRACRPEGSSVDLPKGISQSLLSYPWPGEFAELWRCLQRLALCPASGPLPPPLRKSPNPEAVEELVRASAHAAFLRQKKFIDEARDTIQPPLVQV